MSRGWADMKRFSLRLTGRADEELDNLARLAKRSGTVASYSRNDLINAAILFYADSHRGKTTLTVPEERADPAAVDAFLRAAADGKMQQARALLGAHPLIPRANIYTAGVLGEAETVERMLQQDPALAVRKGGPLQWEPLLYVSVSRFHRGDPVRADGLVRVAKALLAQGADPGTSFHHTDSPWGAWTQTVLYGAAGITNFPALVRVLLEAGADPNDGESLYHAAEQEDNESLKLLIAFGVNPNRTNALKRKLDFPDIEGLRLLLAHGADPNESELSPLRETPLHHAVVRGRNAETVELLIDHGADVSARRADGRTAYALAVRLGNTAVAETLLRHGSDSDLTIADRFIGACARADEQAARAMLSEHPGLVEALPPEGVGALVDLAGFGRSDAVALMLRLGFDPAARGRGHTALHEAAWGGHASTVRVLLQHHAPLEAQDDTYKGTPLGWAIHGSGSGVRGDHVGVVEALLAAGASFHEGQGAHAGEAVAAVLRRHLRS